MRAILLTLALLPAITGTCAPATPPADYPAALAAAKASRSDIVVLFHGSSWCLPGRQFFKLWQEPGFGATLDQQKILPLAIDQQETPDQAGKDLAQRNAGCPVTPSSFPAIAYFDADGRFIGMLNGLPDLGDASNLGAVVSGLHARRVQRDEAWAKAATLAGTAKAEALGHGLDAMNAGLGPKQVYKDVLEEIRKADPADQSQYIAKYTFSVDQLLGMVLGKARENKHSEAESELNRLVANKRLNKDQAAQLRALQYALYSRWPGHEAQTASALAAMRALDPASDLGRAAASKLDKFKPKS